MATPTSKKTEEDRSVDAFLATLDHPAKALVVELRRVVLDADVRILDGIKWNAPSFRTTEYFATTNLRAKQGTGLILHFGAKKNAISATGVDIPDPAGLLRWLAKDRATVEFRDTAELRAKASALQALLREWIRYVV
ncbi:DUF1801 domain-containing protein [Tahibacter sp.]|uniref:DUF1801 domain-containing protein n=1 Tax=Tahibacter sp. TaxID=2056211 RepID=UPI0028C4BB21|nr:DUF1801 domain-containing protein [Tahibacter sp.]